MRARRAFMTMAAVVALGGGIVAVGPGSVANAMCPRNVDCSPPDPVDPPVTPTPKPRPTGDFTSFSALPDFCEPRATPWYTISYTVPGAIRSEVYHQWLSSDPVELVGTYYATSVSVRHQGHGTYTVKSYGPNGQVYTRADSRC